MKKIWFFILLSSAISFLGIRAYAINVAVWTSSNTATADTTQTLCPQIFPTTRGVFHGACVNTGSAGTLTIYDATASATRRVAAINTASAACFYYDVAVSSGLSYTNSATANVTMLYNCY